MQGLQLKLEKVISAEKQVVEGIMYYLVIKVLSKRLRSEYYEAKVLVQAWKETKKTLEGFDKIAKPAESKKWKCLVCV
ncbi:hypothetical protein KP509_10G050900 [Ceratopteris richardii]|uniref:Cystatin domain-containing protein n=1 Tax=Ceratopteris richardii TaxID=49495 RepID=A0A8T2U1B3_CERRI|nr:hypothetical protein KP509_10G050900 [Ceratopteris richardii]